MYKLTWKSSTGKTGEGAPISWEALCTSTGANRAKTVEDVIAHMDAKYPGIITHTIVVVDATEEDV